MTTKHTPTPWTHEGLHGIFGPNGLAIANFRTDHYGNEESSANAAFIVRAVNSHDELVYQVKKLKHRLAEIQAGNAFSWQVLEHDAIEADAALAKARGEDKPFNKTVNMLCPFDDGEA